MSQHVYSTHYSGSLGAFPVKITVGWDRPLQSFFCNVESRPLERLIYCNLDDPSFRADGRVVRLSDIEDRLEALGLRLPKAIGSVAVSRIG
jgi:hypothetical protein